MTGLIGWWPLHEDSGDKAYDLSGNGNHGSLNGGVTKGVAGKGGLTSYSFDGVDGYVLSDTFSSINSGEAYTYSVWIRPESELSGFKDIVVPGLDSTNSHLRFNLETDGSLKTVQYNGSLNSAVSDSSVNFDDWNHVAVVVQGTDPHNWNFYINGSKISSTVTDNEHNDEISTERVVIGAFRDPSYRNFKGQIAGVRIYDRALASEEIKELYHWGNGDFARPLNNENSSSAVSRWALDGDATDSWSSNDGTVNGGLSWSEDAIRGRSAEFNGSDGFISFNPVNVSEDAISVSYWVDYDSTSNVEYTVNNYSGTSSSDKWFILGVGQGPDISEGNWGFQVDDGSSNPGVDSGLAVRKGWHHIVGTYNGSQLSVYVNGVLKSRKTVSLSSIDFSNSDVEAGHSTTGDSGYTEGRLDDVRIYSRALRPDEVFELYRWGTGGRDLRKFTVNSR